MNIISKRILPMILAACLVIGATPLTAFADDDHNFMVSTAEELNNAVTKINSGSGEYTINIQSDFEYPGNSFTKAGTTTTIIGNCHTITLTGSDVLISVWNGATLNLGDVNDETNTLTFIGHENTNDGASAFLIYRGSTCNMYAGTTLKGEVSNNCFGGGFKVSDHSTFNMYGGTITECGIDGGSVCYGGGVSVIVNSTFNMYDGTISKCFANTSNNSWQYPYAAGGGVFVGHKATFNFVGGLIDECSTTHNGGGIGSITSLDAYYDKGDVGYFENRITINNGTISNCTAIQKGGGIGLGFIYFDPHSIGSGEGTATDLSNPGLFISGGEISGCSASDGGGILINYFQPGIPAEICGMTITDNTATNEGAGINIYKELTEAVIDGCTITNNTAGTNGGGVALDKNINYDGSLIKDCTITGNTSGAQGAGVYYDANSTLNISGANIIQNNTWNGVANNLNIYDTTHLVNVTGSLAGSQIGITDPVLRADSSSETAAAKLTSGYKTHNDADPSTLFTSDHETWTPAFSEDGTEVRLVRKPPENYVYLTTKDSVDINFEIDADYYTRDPNAYVELEYNHRNRDVYTVDRRVQRVNLKDVTDDDRIDGRYKFTIESAPAQLTEKINVTLKDSQGNELYKVEDYSMWKYCDEIIQNSISIQNTDVPESVKNKMVAAAQVCKALTDYATIAQVYFNYNTSDMSSKAVNARQPVNFTETVTGQKTYHNINSVAKEDMLGFADGGAVAGVSGELPFEITETTLMSLANTEARFYYDEDINPSDYELSVTTENWHGDSAPTARFGFANSGHFIVVGGIESSNLDNVFHLTIRNKNTNQSATINYSALAYCYTVLRDFSDSDVEKVQQLCSLVKSVYLYNMYAQEYFVG